MLWITAGLIAAVSNLDNLALGVAFGLRGRRFTTAPNSVVAMITMAGTAGAMLFGHVLSSAVPSLLGDVLGSSVIIAIGVWTLATSLSTLRLSTGASQAESTSGNAVHEALSNAVSGGSGAISSREAIPLGLALAVNNVGAGLGAGAAGVPALTTTLLAGLLSLICLGGGSRVGCSFAALVLGRWAPLLSALILLGVGALMLAGLA